jgi:pimeloyl-ACP methyl ester carboxylesterase
MSAKPLQQLPAAWARMGETYRESQGTRYVAIAGTHGWRDGWATDDQSDFALQMHAHNFHMIRTDQGDAFQWSGDLNGLLHRTDWQAGAMALAYFLDGVPYDDRNLIAHSHGGQVVFHYVALGRKIRTLTTVGTPPRSDVPMLLAKPYIGFHQHIYDEKVDWMGWLGQFGEHDLNKSRKMPYADLNISVKDISHSKILRDAAYIPLWFGQGWAQRLETGAGSPA